MHTVHGAQTIEKRLCGSLTQSSLTGGRDHMFVKVPFHEALGHILLWRLAHVLAEPSWHRCVQPSVSSKTQICGPWPFALQIAATAAASDSRATICASFVLDDLMAARCNLPYAAQVQWR